MGKRVAVHASDVRDALRRQIGEAVLVLAGGDVSDEDIHDARKKLKSARAKLKLLRAAIGRAAYARENAALRDASRPLGTVRDSKVMLDAVNALLARKGTRSRRVLLDALRGRLHHRHAAARADLTAGKRAASTANALTRAARRIGRVRVPTRGAAVIARGVERIYRSARKALRAAEREPSAANLHELRKQVKYLRQAIVPYEDFGAREAKKIAKRAEAIGDALGEDHDLYVLAEHIASAEASTHTHSASFKDELGTLRRELEKRALKESRKLLRKKPRSIARRLARA